MLSSTPIGHAHLLQFLEDKVAAYELPHFIPNDPICIPHLFSQPQDIEIAGLFAAIFAWGNRTTIIQKSKDLLQRMDWAPYDFCMQATPRQLKGLAGFKHRTFQEDDLYFFIEFLRGHYRMYQSLETAFTMGMNANDPTIEKGLIAFRNYFFEAPHLHRTQKHLATPLQGSTCKRLNMYLRWMVRSPKKGVDFGIWQQINPAQLICPIDVHVGRVARKLNMLTRKPTDWQAALELTQYLRQLDPADPVKYDFALFGLGVFEKQESAGW